MSDSTSSINFCMWCLKNGWSVSFIVSFFELLFIPRCQVLKNNNNNSGRLLANMAPNQDYEGPHGCWEKAINTKRKTKKKAGTYKYG